MQKMDSIKEHTLKKFEVVLNYLQAWISIATSSNIKNIYFIDCMCNQGTFLYGENEIEGTPMLVYRLFYEYSAKYPEKNFKLFFNDADRKKVEKLENKINDTRLTKRSNLNVIFSDKDVNEFLETFDDF